MIKPARVGRQTEKHKEIVKMWSLNLEIQNMNRIQEFRLRWELKNKIFFILKKKWKLGGG